jgi:DNA-binding transcriptional MerR regulator
VSTTPAAAAALRIGDLAKRTGTTPRTIRYDEEFGLLPEAPGRDAGRHRLYTEADVERLLELLRLKDLLGLSLDELRGVIEAEEARGAQRAEWHEGHPSAERRRQIIEEAQGHIANQLALVRRRREKLDELEGELVAKRDLLRCRLRELDAAPAGARPSRSAVPSDTPSSRERAG